MPQARVGLMGTAGTATHTNSESIYSVLVFDEVARAVAAENRENRLKKASTPVKAKRSAKITVSGDNLLRRSKRAAAQLSVQQEISDACSSPLVKAEMDYFTDVYSA